MSGISKTKKYDLEDRTREFAEQTRHFVKNLPKNLVNFEDAKQLVRSSGSVGSNYIEANEALGKKDFLMRLRICRKEAKESIYWLKLIDTADKSELIAKRDDLLKESTELMCIFGAILSKCR